MNSRSISYPEVDVQHRQALRRLMRHRRNQLTNQQQQQATEAICRQLLDYPKVRTAEHIAVYAAFDAEINIYPLCRHLWQQGKQLYLPQLEQSGHLLFAPYHPQHKLQRNRYGIWEPPPSPTPLLQPLTLLLLPVVAFDINCYRLGMGGGYYDRTLNRYFQEQAPITPPVSIGLAHDCQQVACLPRAAWERPLQAVMTPKQLFLT